MAKKPTGARPTPKIPAVKSAKGAGHMNATKQGIKHTPMIASRRNATMKRG